jgi:hypothetical protein
MCDTIEVNGKRCGTLASLRHALGGEPVIPDADKQGFPQDCCLCVVDVEATAKAYGFESRFDACWLIHHFERPAQRRKVTQENT